MFYVLQLWLRRIRLGGVILSGIDIVVVVAVMTLYGCAAPVREQVFDDSGPTTEQVWHGAGTATELLGDHVGWNPGGASGAAAWTRSAENELSALFPELRNPRITLYVFPHLTVDGAPVPGYATFFHLYEGSSHFALPGEAFREGILK